MIYYIKIRNSFKALDKKRRNKLFFVVVFAVVLDDVISSLLFSMLDSLVDTPQGNTICHLTERLGNTSLQIQK